MEFAGDHVVDNAGTTIPTLQILDTPSWEPCYGYAAWTYRRPINIPETGGCRLQNLSADVPGGVNNVVRTEKWDNSEMSYLKSSYEAIDSLDSHAVMWNRKMNFRTKLGYTLKANKGTNRWFVDDYEDMRSQIGVPLNELGGVLSRLHFHQERYDLKKESLLNPEHGRFDEQPHCYAWLKHLFSPPNISKGIFPANKTPTQIYNLGYVMEITSTWYNKTRKNNYTA